MLKGKIKKFDQKLYDIYDTPAREIIKKKLGECVKDNPDIYAEDLLIENDKCKYKFIELQVCAKWTNNDYPFKLPFVFERKGHFSDKTLFIILNKDMNKGLLFGKKFLKKEPRRYKKYSRYFVYEIDWFYVMRFYCEYLDMDLLEIY